MRKKRIPGSLIFTKLQLLFWLNILLSQTLLAGNIPIGVWRHHLPNSNVISITEKNGFIYGATPYGLLEYDKSYNSIRKIDKVDGLTDFGITVVSYSSATDMLLIGYQNGNLDLITNGSIINIPDIRQSNILGSKSIHNIYFDNELAYLSCGFGIVVLELNDLVILDTWFIGPEASMLNVYDLTKTENAFFAATEAGLLTADLNAPNLADFQYWKREAPADLPTGAYNHVEKHAGHLFANLNTPQSDSLYYYDGLEWKLFKPEGVQGIYETTRSLRSKANKLIIGSWGRILIFDEKLLLENEFEMYAGRTVSANDALMDKQGILWAADRNAGLIKGTVGNGFEMIRLPGPATSESYALAHNVGALWVAPGSLLGGWENTFNDRGMFAFNQGVWRQISRWQFPELASVLDFHQVTPHVQNPARVYAAAWAGGLAEFDLEQGLVEIYDDTNSTLQKRTGSDDIIRVGGSAWDSRQNLWVSNSDAAHFLSVKKSDGNWLSFPHNGLITGNETLGRIVVDNADQKWIAMPRGGGIIVFKEDNLDNNLNFEIRKLDTRPNNGALPSTRVTTLAKDKDGYIWVGTNGGVVVFYAPQLALSSQTVNAQPIIVMQDGFAGRLFENETINSIFVDGSNKKWFATQSSGAFLLSADGRETLMHFTRSNSPLPSNNILDISVDPQTGEVFFATDLGLVSWRGFATEGQRQHSDVYAFPNPVRPGYNGYIAVKGLVTNARVKITDINGNLVYDTFAEGGQMVWNGRDLNGRRPSSGVYLVFSTNPQGEETVVSKLLFLK